LIPFINIHTHHIDDSNDVISIVDFETALPEEKDKIKLFSAGIHPWNINLNNIEQQMLHLESLLTKKCCLAVGECGLDKLKGPDIEVQKIVFDKQIQLSIAYQKPIVVHCVQAFDILVGIIKKYQNKTTFIVHGFNQNEQIAGQLLKLGVYLSFGSALLNRGKERLKHIFANTNPHQVFIENDNEAISVAQIYTMAASIKNCELDVMKEIIFANFKTVFKYE
jgi:TatD DNase family protein